ncbi:MAG: excisionase family DNA-binding protein, partial [Pseudomonadota bacterium]
MGTRRAAEVLGVSVRTVQLWVENGTLSAWKTPGNHRRILKSSVDRVLAERTSTVQVEVQEPRDILVVEDELAMQAYYEAMLELLRPDVAVRFASNGFDALVEFGRSEPALMLT